MTEVSPEDEGDNGTHTAEWSKSEGANETDQSGGTNGTELENEGDNGAHTAKCNKSEAADETDESGGRNDMELENEGDDGTHAEEYNKSEAADETDESGGTSYIELENEEDWKTETTPKPTSLFGGVSFRAAVVRILKGITIEPALLLAVLATSLQQIPAGYMTLSRICTVEEQNSLVKCDHILYNASYHSDKIILQRKATDWGMIITAVCFLPGLWIKLVAGSWSDKYGRKPMLIMANIGTLLRSVTLLLLQYFKNAGMKWFAASDLITSVFAGAGAYAMAISYVSDDSSKEGRAHRILMVGLTGVIGSSIGQYSGGLISERFGNEKVFTTSAVLAVLAMFYILLFVKETIDSNASVLQKLIGFFNYRHIKYSFETLFRKRKSYLRLHLLMLLSASAIDGIVRGCKSTVDFLYTQERYDWTQSEYGRMQAITLVGGTIIFSVGGYIFFKKLKFTDIKLALVGFTSGISAYAICAFAYYAWIFYVAQLTGSFSVLPDIMIQSKLTKLVDPSEIGKIMTIQSVIGAIAGPETNIGFTALYKAGLGFFVGLPYLVAASLYIFPFACFAIMHYKRIKEDQPLIES